jgi:3-hydroxyisobutyryl-CoA hydrolase
VASLAENNKKGPNWQQASAQFFGLEYRLDHLIATYSKPYVSFMDGITMGGGVGLSVHAPFRIATERTVFAMPETKIGFFPDVGGGFFLSRLDGEIGTYLALTGETLKGVHALYAGIATHYLDSSSLEDLEQRLAELVFPDGESLQYKNTIVNSTIEEYVTGLPPNEPFVLSGSLREAIDRCFAFDTIEEILTALSNETVHKEWAENTIATITSRSPTSVRVALRQLRLGRDWTIADTFQREFHIASRFMSHPDFIEGVTSVLAKKKKGEPREPPVWTPPTLEELPESAIEEFFIPPEGTKKLELLKPGAHDYREYPHAMFGLPSEAYLKHVVQRGRRMTPREFVNAVVAEHEGKAGVREKVWDFLNRKTEKDENGYVKWKSTTPVTTTTPTPAPTPVTTTTTEEV